MSQSFGTPQAERPRAEARHGLEATAEVAARVKSEFDEMPGMCLTLEQASRLLTLDRTTCEHLLGKLVADGFLFCDRAGYRRRNDA